MTGIDFEKPFIQYIIEMLIFLFFLSTLCILIFYYLYVTYI